MAMENDVLNLYDDLLENKDHDEQQEQENESQFSGDDFDELLNHQDEDAENEKDDNENDKEQNKEEQEAVFEKFEENDSINRILQSKGLDPHSIIYEDEDGKEVNMNFYDLDPEEQYSLLNYNPSQYDLEENEIETINFLRQNDISLEDYTNYIKNQAIEEFNQNNQSYNVDDYSDDEVFIEALKNQYPDLTDEETQSELDKEKANDVLFSKKVSQIRSFYKEQEDIENRKTEESTKLKEEQELQDSQNKLANSAVNLKEFMGFEIDDEDRKDAFKSIFNKDINGKSLFFKMLEDPDKLIKAALFVLKEEQISKTLEKEFKKINNNNKPPIIKSPFIQPTSKVSVNTKTSKTSQQPATKGLANVDDLYKEIYK